MQKPKTYRTSIPSHVHNPILHDRMPEWTCFYTTMSCCGNDRHVFFNNTTCIFSYTYLVTCLTRLKTLPISHFHMTNVLKGTKMIYFHYDVTLPCKLNLENYNSAKLQKLVYTISASLFIQTPPTNSLVLAYQVFLESIHFILRSKCNALSALQVTGTLQHIQQAQNLAAASPQLPSGVQVKQYNSPLPLYSQENVQEALRMQASQGMNPVHP